MIAFAQEPALAAVFVDSPFDNLPQIIREALDREGYPQMLYYAGVWYARWFIGDDLIAHNPYEAVENANGRPLFVLHRRGDDRIGVQHSLQLQERAITLGAEAEFWIIEDPELGHVMAAAAYPDVYRATLVDFFNRAFEETP